MHISSKRNDIADDLSLCQWDHFRHLAAAAQDTPRNVPKKFHCLISNMRLMNASLAKNTVKAYKKGFVILG